VAGRGVQLGRLLNREGILVPWRTVAAVRVRSRLVVTHGLMIPRRVSTSRGLSPIYIKQGNRIAEMESELLRFDHLDRLVRDISAAIMIPTSAMKKSSTRLRLMF
jgi:hypothetical protein